MTVTLTKIYRSDKDKQGNQLVTKDGRNYTKCAIKTKEHGDKWLSGFGNSENNNWKEGDSVEIIVEEKGQYLNFKTLPKTVSRDEFNKLVSRVEYLEGQLTNNKPVPQQQEEDDIPF